MPGEASRRGRTAGTHGRPRPTSAPSPGDDAAARRKGLWAAAIMAAPALFLAWEIVATSAADSLASGRPETALAWRSNAPAALVGWAQQQLSAPEGEADLRSVEAALLDALRADPLDSRTLRLLGLVAERNGDPDRAARFMRLAVARNVRDVGAQTWLFAHTAGRGDVDAAMAHLDALLRARPALGEPLLPIMVELVRTGEAVPAIVARLAGNPPWRDWFIRAVSQEMPGSAALAGMFTALRSTPSPPSAGELSAFLWRLISGREYERAYLNWFIHLPPSRLASLGRINNGDFEQLPSGLPFDWRFPNIQGAVTGVARAGNRSQALRVSFYGARVPYRNAHQVLLLPAGRYELSGRVRADDLRNERGMRWTISCADTRARLGQTELVRGTVPWSDFSATFDVPDGRACRAQMLELELAARIPAEAEVQGEIWYDDLRIERLAPDQIATPSDNMPEAGNLQ